MRTLSKQYSDYNVVIDMVYRLSDKDRMRLMGDLSNLTEKKAKQKEVDKGYTYDVVPPELQAIIDEGVADHRAGRCKKFANAKEAVKFLNSL
jgi:hypothetical protein